MNDFENKGTTKKGEHAEEIIRNWLFERGHRPTMPAHTGPHPIDMFVMDQNGKVFAIDAKAKAKRRNYDDTGIDYSHYNTYFDLEKNANIDVWVFFVDHLESWVYGATLEELRRPVMDPPGCKPGQYPRKEGSIIYFARSSMHKLFKLTAKQCAELEQLSLRDKTQMRLIA